MLFKISFACYYISMEKKQQDSVCMSCIVICFAILVDIWITGNLPLEGMFQETHYFLRAGTPYNLSAAAETSDSITTM